jgi:hypothetical protein
LGRKKQIEDKKNIAIKKEKSFHGPGEVES